MRGLGPSRSGPSTASISGTGASSRRSSTPGPKPTVVTFDPHPRTALGNRVELLMPLERRLELLAELGVAEALVVEFTLEVARLDPREFADQFLRPIGAETVVAGEDFRFGHKRAGDLAFLDNLGFATRPVAACRGRLRDPDPRARAGR